jgi:hypothetical protein
MFQEVIDKNGNTFFYKDGKIHSYNDEPAIIFSDGTKHWYKDGKLHREDDLPAGVYFNGDLYYYHLGERHRYDGPAVILVDGTELYYWHGLKVSKSRLMSLCRAKRKRDKNLKRIADPKYQKKIAKMYGERAC